MTETTEIVKSLPEDFFLIDGEIIYTSVDGGHWCRQWNVVEMTDRHVWLALTPGQRAAIRDADLFFVPKYGKPGWNTRKTFPTQNARAAIGFLMSVNGKVWRFTPRKGLVRR